MASIIFDKVNKYFGPRQVLKDLSFRVEPGEIVGLLGPNGSGKTTTLRLTAGYYQPDGGVLDVMGMSQQRLSARPGAYVGYLPERAPLYDSLTVLQYLQFVARCKGLKGKALATSVDASVSAFDLGSVTRTAIGRLSKGFRQRVGLGQALLGDPAVLLLDEATNGLDPMQIIEAREMIRAAASGRAVIFSSHLMQEVQALCTRAIILRHGRLIADIPLSTHGTTKNVKVSLRWKGEAPERLVSAIESFNDVLQVDSRCTSQASNEHFLKVCFGSRPLSLNPLLSRALALGQVLEVYFDDDNIEDVLVNAVRESDRQAAFWEGAA